MSAQQWQLVCVCVCLQFTEGFAVTRMTGTSYKLHQRQLKTRKLWSPETSWRRSLLSARAGEAAAAGNATRPGPTEDTAGSVCTWQSTGPCSLKTHLTRPCIIASFFFRRSELAVGSDSCTRTSLLIVIFFVSVLTSLFVPLLQPWW